MITPPLRLSFGRPFRMVMVSVAILLVASPSVLAQGGGGNGEGGVYIDADGAIAAKPTNPAVLQRLYAKRIVAAESTQAELTYISLPRLVAAAAEFQRSNPGAPLPDELLYLHGLTDIQYLFIYPADGQSAGDIVIAGRAEALAAESGGVAMPLASQSHRPYVRLTDLIELFSLTGPGASRGSAFGCSIDLPTDAPARVDRALAGEKQPRSAGERQRQSRNLIDAIGRQPVRYFGFDADSPISRACLEADYLLKRITIGLDPSPVAALRHTFTQSGTVFNRWWFTAAPQPLITDGEGLAFQIRQPLRLSTSGDPEREAPATESAERYAATFTEHFPAIAAAIPQFSHLEKLADLALVASLIRRDALDRAAGWDASTLHQLNLTGERVEPAMLAQTLVNYRDGSYAVGGVVIQFDQATDPSRRQPDTDNQLAELRDRPAGDDWHSARPIGTRSR